MLTDVEQRTLDAYVATLREYLGERLLAIRIFGSVARRESWPAGMRIRSDLDLLVLVARPLADEEVQHLADATFPLFLESGRQISPQFRTPEQHATSPSRAQIDRDAVEIWPCP